MGDSADELRREAERLAELATAAEERAARQEAMLAALLPEQRIAILLHDHFARTYPGAGGAMDGGDPWYYETTLEAGQIREHDWSGHEHSSYVRMARTLANQWAPSGTTSWDAVWEQLEAFLRAMATSLKGRDTEAVRVRARRREDHELDRLKDEAVAAIEKLHEKAATR